jgi:hypothetical protein
MKISQPKTGIAEKKPQSSSTLSANTLSAGAASKPSIDVGTSKAVFESPSAAVWSKYIDSRMKQFGTR